jgi:hypothetical protein
MEKLLLLHQLVHDELETWTHVSQSKAIDALVCLDSILFMAASDIELTTFVIKNKITTKLVSQGFKPHSRGDGNSMKRRHEFQLLIEK